MADRGERLWAARQALTATPNAKEQPYIPKFA